MRIAALLLRLFLPSAVCLLGCCSPTCLDRRTLDRWAMPADLCLAVQHLSSLRLPAAVDRLDWLPANLKVLDAHGTSVVSLAGLPPDLESLDVSDTSLTAADLRALPGSLKSLTLGSNLVKTLPDLPAGLQNLTITGAAITSVQSLPDSLLALTIDSTPVEYIAAWPPHLRSLTLKGTHLASIKGLPQSLDRLVMSENVELEENASLPQYLSYFSTDSPNLPDPEALRFLYALELPKLTFVMSTASRPSTASRLPRMLVELSGGPFDAIPPGDFPPGLQKLSLVCCAPEFKIPPSVTSLELRGCLERTLKLDLPPRLEVLDLETCPQDRPFSLPALLPFSSKKTLKLRSINLNGSRVTDLAWLFAGASASLLELSYHTLPLAALPELPPKLITLDLTGSRKLAQLCKLPPSLQVLRIGHTGIGDLSAIPQGSNLRVLDISYTPIKRLSNLPAKLEQLTIAPGQVKKLGNLPASLHELDFTKEP